MAWGVREDRNLQYVSPQFCITVKARRPRQGSSGCLTCWEPQMVTVSAFFWTTVSGRPTQRQTQNQRYDFFLMKVLINPICFPHSILYVEGP